MPEEHKVIQEEPHGTPLQGKKSTQGRKKVETQKHSSNKRAQFDPSEEEDDIPIEEQESVPTNVNEVTEEVTPSAAASTSSTAAPLVAKTTAPILPQPMPAELSSKAVQPVQQEAELRAPTSATVTPQFVQSKTTMPIVGVPIASATFAIPFKELCKNIEKSVATKTGFEFKENSTTEGTLKKLPDFDEVKIKKQGDSAMCMFTGSRGIEESTKILLDSFISSGQTSLTIDGTSPSMVITLAKLVERELGTNNPHQLTVTLTKDARAALGSNTELLKKLDATAKPQQPSASPPRMT